MITFKLKMKELYHKMFDGEVTFDKSTFWLIASVFFLTGVLYGLLKAPMTHGVNISLGSHNGSNNGSNNHDNTGNGLTHDEKEDDFDSIEEEEE